MRALMPVKPVRSLTFAVKANRTRAKSHQETWNLNHYENGRRTLDEKPLQSLQDLVSYILSVSKRICRNHGSWRHIQWCR